MANQYVNKVVVGADVKLALSQDTISPDKLAKNITAHDKSGAPIVGTSTLDVDSSDATAAVAEILKGKTAYARGTKLTGTWKKNNTRLLNRRNGFVLRAARGTPKIKLLTN